jgi:hypothetical protein
MNAPLPTAQADPAHQLERSTRQQQLVAAVAPLLPAHALDRKSVV